MTGWRIWCPVCRRHRQTRIPAGVDTRIVVAEYDAHMKTHKGSEQ